MRKHPDGALHGADGQVVYADILTAGLYGHLREERRREARAMLEAAIRGTTRIAPEDVSGITIHEAEIRVRDSIAECRIVFKRTNGRPDQDADGKSLRIQGEMSAAVMDALVGRDMAEVTGHEIMRGMRVTGVQGRGSVTEIKYMDEDTSYIIDNQDA